MDLSALPEGCLSHILSLTSPVDVLRSSVVSKQFLSASNSDAVWEKFVPSDYLDIISSSSSSSSSTAFEVEYRSKKELFFLLCRSPRLIDGNTSVALDKWSGRKSYMLGARALVIKSGDIPAHWVWTSIPESRFPEVAKLQDAHWMDIKGTLHTKVLTPSTTYGVYFVYKLGVNEYSFELIVNKPIKATISEIDRAVLYRNNRHKVVSKKLYLMKCGKKPIPVRRGDEWMEIEMGTYEVGNNSANEKKVLEMNLRELDFLHWKKGLLVYGIELRPLH